MANGSATSWTEPKSDAYPQGYNWQRQNDRDFDMCGESTVKPAPDADIRQAAQELKTATHSGDEKAE